jgi:methanogenic corrinoid protein MtbC1
MNTFDAYFAALAAADAPAALGVLVAAQTRGEPTDVLIRDVIRRAQEKAGQLWFTGEWDVADEHVATGISEQVLTLLAPPSVPDASATRLVLACAEGEWHTFPARLTADLARTGSLDIVMLGGSVPADHLQRHLRARRPRALALSCTMVTNLIGAVRSIAAAHAEGIPVIVGGAAWGPGQHRARRLGADLRVDEASDLPAAVVAMQSLEPSNAGRSVPIEALLLDAVPPELLQVALQRQCATSAWMRDMSPFQRDRSLEDLRWIARHAAAAVACDDPTIVRDIVTWLIELLIPRGVPVKTVLDSVRYLADSVESEAPVAASLLRQEAHSADERGRTGELPPPAVPPVTNPS